MVGGEEEKGDLLFCVVGLAGSVVGVVPGELLEPEGVDEV